MKELKKIETHSPKGIRTLMEELAEQNRKDIADKKVKGFKLPWGIRLFGRGALKKNYVIVCFINDNKNVQFMKVPIDQMAIMIKETPYLATAEHMMTYNNKPMLIVPSWNTEPFSPKQNMEEAERNRTLTLGYRILLNKMKVEVELVKKKMNLMVVLGGIALVIGLIYLISKGGSMPKLI